MTVKFARVCWSVVLAGAFAAAVQAATVISYTGTLRTDATVLGCGSGCTLDAGSTDAEYAQFAAVVVTFIVPSPVSVRAISFSYGGGTNGNGALIAQGGFAPYFSLFDGTGNFLLSTHPSSPQGELCPAGSIPYLGCYDVALNMGSLAAGSYQLALSAYFNLSTAENLGSGTLADGFTGLGNLFQGEDLHYAFDIILDTPAVDPVPEPSGAVLCGMAVIAFAVMKLVQRRN